MWYLIAFMNILGLWFLTLIFYSWIIQDFKQRKKGLTVIGIIVGIVMLFNFYLACFETPAQVRALTTQVNNLNKQLGAKP